MNESVDARYYRLALYKAKRRDLSGAVQYARRALRIDAGNKKARLLLGVCLYELGDLENAVIFLEESTDILIDARYEQELVGKKLDQARELAESGKWRKAEASLRDIEHQSVRILTIRGCMKAAAGKYLPAADIFARALEKDKENRAAAAYLAEAAGRGNKAFWQDRKSL